MNYFEQIESTHYGSFELRREVGPNLMKGLAASFLIHAMVVLVPVMIALFGGAEKIAPPLRVINASEILKPMRQQSTPQQFSIATPTIATPKAMVPIPVPDEPIGRELLPTLGKLIDLLGRSVDTGLGFDPGVQVFIDEPPKEEEIPSQTRYIAYQIKPEPLPDFSPRPAYPKLAGESGVNGLVVALIYIDKHGIVKHVQIDSVKPIGLGFDEEVLKVIWNWRFTPAIQNKSPIGVWIEQRFTFNIED